jgi:hypothetical protein
VPSRPARRRCELPRPLRQHRDELDCPPEGIRDRTPAGEGKRRAQLAADLGHEHRHGLRRRRRIELGEAAERLGVGGHRHADRERLRGIP